MTSPLFASQTPYAYNGAPAQFDETKTKIGETLSPGGVIIVAGTGRVGKSSLLRALSSEYGGIHGDLISSPESRGRAYLERGISRYIERNPGKKFICTGEFTPGSVDDISELVTLAQEYNIAIVVDYRDTRHPAVAKAAIERQLDQTFENIPVRKFVLVGDAARIVNNLPLVYEDGGMSAVDFFAGGELGLDIASQEFAEYKTLLSSGQSGEAASCLLSLLLTEQDLQEPSGVRFQHNHNVDPR
jgi:hypothetical protein